MIEKVSNWLKQLFNPSTFKAQAAGFDYRRLVATVQNGGSFAVDLRYGITTRPGPRPGYRAYVYHLTGSENGGKHHIFFEVRGKNGNRPQGLKVGYTWVGRRPDEPAPLIPLDKPIEEPWGNKELGAGQIAEVWLTDLNGNEIGSDHVIGIHTGHDSDGLGNHRFHHSFFVLWYWEELELGGPTPPNGEPDPPANGDVLARLDALEAGLRSANMRLEQVVEGLRVATGKKDSPASLAESDPDYRKKPEGHPPLGVM